MFQRTLLAVVLCVACGDDDAPIDGGVVTDANPRADASSETDANASEDSGGLDGGNADSGGGSDDAGPVDGGGDSAAPDAGCASTDARFFLIGDSTVSTRSGWGDALSMFLVSDVEVFNPAVSGSSSRSFYEGGHFDEARGELTDGDYLFIQFGHNDSKDGDRFTEPGEAPDYLGTYRDYIEMYIAEARAAGAQPVLVTSMSRMTFGGDGAHRRTHGEYAPAVRQFAIDNDVVLLDLESHSHDVFDELGEDETVRLYAGYNDDPTDRTHFPAEKAPRVAAMVAELMRGTSLACFVAAE